MLRFRRMRTLQKFASVHASVHDHFPTERHLQNRDHCKLYRAAALASGAAFSQPDAPAVSGEGSRVRFVRQHPCRFIDAWGTHRRPHSLLN